MELNILFFVPFCTIFQHLLKLMTHKFIVYIYIHTDVKAELRHLNTTHISNTAIASVIMPP